MMKKLAIAGLTVVVCSSLSVAAFVKASAPTISVAAIKAVSENPTDDPTMQPPIRPPFRPPVRSPFVP